MVGFFFAFQQERIIEKLIDIFLAKSEAPSYLVTGISVTGKICPYLNISTVSFNTLLESRGNTSGRNMNPVHLHYRSKQWEADHDSNPVMLLVVVFMPWELQTLPVSQGQVCVGFHVGWRKTLSLPRMM